MKLAFGCFRIVLLELTSACNVMTKYSIVITTKAIMKTKYFLASSRVIKVKNNYAIRIII